MIERHEFITLIGGAAAWPVAAQAQQATMPVIGLLGATSFDNNVERLGVFRQGLKEIGYVEGENVAIEYRWAEGQYERPPALTGDLVRRQVSVIWPLAQRLVIDQSYPPIASHSILIGKLKRAPRSARRQLKQFCLEV